MQWDERPRVPASRTIPFSWSIFSSCELKINAFLLPQVVFDSVFVFWQQQGKKPRRLPKHVSFYINIYMTITRIFTWEFTFVNILESDKLWSPKYFWSRGYSSCVLNCLNLFCSWPRLCFFLPCPLWFIYFCQFPFQWLQYDLSVLLRYAICFHSYLVYFYISVSLFISCYDLNMKRRYMVECLVAAGGIVLGGFPNLWDTGTGPRWQM